MCVHASFACKFTQAVDGRLELEVASKDTLLGTKNTLRDGGAWLTREPGTILSKGVVVGGGSQVSGCSFLIPIPQLLEVTTSSIHAGFNSRSVCYLEQGKLILSLIVLANLEKKT